MNKFDGGKVVETKFGNLTKFSRFFTDNGEGYTKVSENTCIDDYNEQRIITIGDEDLVWIKETK